MIVGEATTTISATPDEVFDFVLDRIATARRITRSGEWARSTTEAIAGRLNSRAASEDCPPPSGTYPFTRTDSRLAFGSPIAGPARWFINFEGTFDTERTQDGTVVTHRETFSFKRPWQWLAEPLLRSWLEKDTTEEMVRFKQLIERVDDMPASEQ